LDRSVFHVNFSTPPVTDALAASVVTEADDDGQPAVRRQSQRTAHRAYVSGGSFTSADDNESGSEIDTIGPQPTHAFTRASARAFSGERQPLRHSVEIGGSGFGTVSFVSSDSSTMPRTRGVDSDSDEQNAAVSYTSLLL
jgi:hypothetical protein